MKRKILITLLSLVCALTCSLGLAACTDDAIWVKEVLLDKTELTLESGQEADLSVKIIPDNATYQTVMWETSSPSVATVDENGKVTAVSEGTAEITARVDSARATCTVTVKDKVKVQFINLKPLILLCGTEGAVDVSVSPSDAETELVWKIEPESVATFDDGKVTAVSQGEATLTATADGVSSSCKITVTEDGFNYLLNDDGESYCVQNNYYALENMPFDFTEAEISSEFNGKPVTKIGRWAFQYLYDTLKTIKIPASITEIDFNTIIMCNAIESFVVDENNPEFSSVDGILYNKEVTECVRVPINLKGDITIPETITEISDYMFANRSELQSVKMHDGITSIGASAFDDCLGLHSFTVTKNVTEIGKDAFFGCYKLWEIYNFSSLTIETGGEDIFSAPNGGIGYYALLVITDETASGGLHETDDGFTFYTANGNTYLVDYTGTESQITLPDEYDRHSYIINSFAFFDNDNITSIIIPDGAVTGIKSEAFSNCHNLKELTLPTGLQNIGMTAFGSCGLENIAFNGTIAQWNAVDKHPYWNRYMYDYTIICTDGKLDKDGNEIAE